MALQNLLGELALDATVATVRTAVDAVTSAVNLVKTAVDQVKTALTDGSQQTQVTNFPATQTVAGSVALNGSTLDTLAQGQIFDAGNSATRTSAHGATTFEGAWTPTRDEGIVRILTVLDSTVPTGLGGTFVFQFSEDGATATVDEARLIGDFETLRDFDLLNAGAYYRVQFTPSRALTGAEQVFIATTLRKQNDGAFVRLADQEIEQANAALPSSFAYLKAFDAITGKSTNVPPPATSGTDADNALSTPLGANQVWEGEWKDIESHGNLLFLYAIQPVSEAPASVQVQYSDDQNTVLSTTTVAAQQVMSGPFTFAVYLAIANGNYAGKYARPKVTNGPVAQTSTPVSIFSRNKFPFNGSYAALDSTLTLFSQALLTRSVLAGTRPDGTFSNIEATDQGDLRVGQHAVQNADNTVVAAPIAAYLGTPYVPASGGATVVAPPADCWVGTWTRAADYAQVGIFAATTSPLGQGYLEWSTDGGVTGAYTETTPFAGAGSFSVPTNGATHCRIVFQNRSPAPFTFTCSTIMRYLPVSQFLFPAGGVIDPSFPAALVKATNTAQDPSGNFANQRAGGLVTLSPAPTAQGAGGVYTSNVIDALGYTSVGLLISTNVPSAVNGVDIQFSDTAAFTVVRGHTYISFTTADAAKGSDYNMFPPQARYMKIVYTNGATPSSGLFLSPSLNVGQIEPSSPQQVVPTKGTYGGQAGISGTVNVPAGAVVRSFAAQSGTVGASITVPGVAGNITVPGSNQASTQYADDPDPGTMVGPCAFTFSNTAAYVVVWVL